MRYRVNPAVAIYPDYTLSDPALIAVDFVGNEQFRISDRRLLDVLYGVDGWTDEGDVVDTVATVLDTDREAAASVFETLEDGGLLISESGYAARVAAAAADWADYGWRAAFEYFLFTKDYPFIDYSRDDAFSRDLGRMDDYLEEEPIPSLYKTYDDAETVDLPAVDGDEFEPTFADVISTSPYDSARESAEPLTRETLATVLFYTFGEIGKIEFPVQGKFLRRTSPSGGARHPTEAYVAVRDVPDVPTGLYHYSVKRHELERLAGDDAVDELGDVVPELDRVGFPWSFLVVYTSVLERNMWRYRESRTYRALVHDVGHLIQTLNLVTKAQGWQSYVGHGFHDRELEAELGLDGFEEPAFRFAAVGAE